MAGGLVQAEANRLLDASLRGVAYTLPTTPMKNALLTTTGSATAAGTEVTGGTYARATITLGTAAAAGSVSNTATVDHTGMPAATTTGIDVYDSNGSPRRAWWGPLTASRTTLAGDILSFAIGALVFNLV
jgi:hypothetical protein